MKKIPETRRCLAALLTFGLAAGALWAQSSNPETAKSAESEHNDKKPKRTVAAPQASNPDPQTNGLYEQARKYAAKGNLEMAIATYETLLQQADSRNDAQDRLQALRQQLEQKQLAEKLEQTHAAGMAALKARDWPRALLAFEKILAHNPAFRDTGKRLAEAQSKLARENTEAIAARYYALGLVALRWNDLGEARAAFEKVQQLKPDYRDVTPSLQILTRALEQTAADHDPARLALGDSLYHAAITAASQGDWTQAVVAFEKLHILQPNYRDVVEQLAQARATLASMQPPRTTVAEPPQNGVVAFFQDGGQWAALLAVPVLGWLLLLPAVRVRRHLLRQDYRSAAGIYEKMLIRNPSRVKYIAKLANIYLLEGRKDEGAMKVYKTVLQLNLAVNNREEINTVVAQQYLQEGRTDSDAIEVLEKQLEAELHRQNHALVRSH